MEKNRQQVGEDPRGCFVFIQIVGKKNNQIQTYET